MEFLDFENEKLYEIQDAFRTLPEKVITKVESVMRNVFHFAGNASLLLRILDEAQHRYIKIEENFGKLKTRYDRAFYIYLHHRDLWEQTCAFMQVDCLPSRHWCRCPNLPRKPPMTDQATCDNLGRQISAFFWQKQVRGKKYLIEYQRRSNGLHYYFVYLSDYSNSYEAWSELRLRHDAHLFQQGEQTVLLLPVLRGQQTRGVNLSSLKLCMKIHA
ncbi:MAG: hypothetical protein IKA71_07275 [Lentisphaeria bacterium]|nr:hypothetical protein [Lentisphaeria bacterium]